MKYPLPFFILIFFTFNLSAQNKFDNQINIINGDTFLIRRNIISVTTQDIMGTQQSIKKEETIFGELVVKESKSVDTFIYELCFKKKKSKIVSEGLNFEYNTDSINSDDIQTKVYQTIINKPVQIRQTRLGNIVYTANLDSVFQFNYLTEADENLLIQIRSSVLEEIKKLLTEFLIPANNKQVGTKWVETDTITIGIYDYFNRRYDYLSDNDGIKQVYKQADITTNPENTVYLGRVYIQYSLNGEQIVKNLYSKQTGTLNESVITESIIGKSGMKYADNTDVIYSWPLQIENKIITQIQKKE